LHWFSSENEFWALGDVCLDEDEGRLTLCLDHEDEPIPIEALRWLAIVGKLELRVARLE
jgi:hypothetical protein